MNRSSDTNWRYAHNSGSYCRELGPVSSMPCSPKIRVSYCEMSNAARVSPSTCLSSFSYSPLSMYSSAVRCGTISFATMRLTLLRLRPSPRNTRSMISFCVRDSMASTKRELSTCTSASRRDRWSKLMPSLILRVVATHT